MRGTVLHAPGPRALRVPLLYLGSTNDWRAPAAEARSIFSAVGSRAKRQVLYRGSWHGWQLVQNAPFAARARAEILRWIRAHP